MNSFWYFKDINAWLTLPALYSIHQGAVSVLFVYIVMAGFTLVLDIIRVIVFGLFHIHIT